MQWGVSGWGYSADYPWLLEKYRRPFHDTGIFGKLHLYESVPGLQDIQLSSGLWKILAEHPNACQIHTYRTNHGRCIDLRLSLDVMPESMVSKPIRDTRNFRPCKRPERACMRVETCTNFRIWHPALGLCPFPATRNNIQTRQKC